MALRGPAPKPDDERTRRNAPLHSKTNVQWDGITRGPELPEDHQWSKRTREWWDTWRNSPQSMVMTATDWEVMLETALLHTQLWEPWNGKAMGAVSITQLASEVRRRVAAYGATFEDRLKLRMQIETPLDGAAPSEQDIQRTAKKVVDYAQRLGATS